MKLTVLGGGGVRAPYLMKTLVLNAATLGIDTIYLMDNNSIKLEIFGTLSQGIASIMDEKVRVVLTTDAKEALQDADYIITTLRVGGDEGRLFDEELAQKFHVLGQETTGVGGFAMAMRSIPILKEYLDLAKNVSKPNVLVFNFTNPSGLVTQALLDEGYQNVYGICDGPTSFVRQLAQMLKSEPKDFDATCYGLNHLSFYRDFKLNGKDCSEEVIRHCRLFKETEMKIFGNDVISVLSDELPNEYLYFFFYQQQVLRNIEKAGHARGWLIQDINKRMIDELKSLEHESLQVRFTCYIKYLIERENSYFAIESEGARDNHRNMVSMQEFIDAPDDGGYSGIALNIIRGLQGKEAVPMTILVRNEGYIKGLREDDVIEITCDMKDGNIHPRTIYEIPDVQLHYIQTIKSYERLSVEAIREKSRKKAVQALLIHPLINSMEVANELLDILLVEYSQYTGEWQ